MSNIFLIYFYVHVGIYIGELVLLSYLYTPSNSFPWNMFGLGFVFSY